MDSRIKKVKFRGGRVDAIMDNGNQVKLFDYTPKLPPFKEGDLRGKTLAEAFEFKKNLERIPII
jgi:hypothetical protein